MITAVREWLVSIVTVSLAVSLAELLVSPGTLRRVLSMTGGLILLLVMLRPILGADLRELTLDGADYRREIAQRQEELQNVQEEQLAKLIAERTESYILEKADALGLHCTVRVSVRPGADGVPLPAGAALDCAYSSELSAYLTQELGISRERQSWNGT